MPSGKLYRWEFERRGAPMIVDPPGNLTLDSVEMMVEAATSGLGLAYVPQIRLDTLLAEGCLKTVLDEWCPEFEGLCLYYSGRRHLPAALRAFIDVLKQVG
jgi:DNA-binding transcriptional LysR family regulator